MGEGNCEVLVRHAIEDGCRVPMFRSQTNVRFLWVCLLVDLATAALRQRQVESKRQSELMPSQRARFLPAIFCVGCFAPFL
jgi:hypothetical protein